MTYWAGHAFQTFNWKQRTGAVLPQGAAAFVERCTEWVRFDDLCAQFGGAGVAATVSDLLDTLVGLGVLESSDAPEAPSPWDTWHPDAAFFHYATKDQRYDRDPLQRDAVLREKARREPPPAATKRVAPSGLALPPAVATDIDATLTKRRTWRQFGDGAVSLEALATLLDRTFRVHAWVHVREQGLVAFKTSPSAGARTPIEAYVVALSVDGVPSGVYHYDAAGHYLVDLGTRLERQELVDALAHQHYYRGVAALVIMTAVFERSMWRYPFGRAYRMVLIDAGHLGQTFCLTAAALDLAPFCTMAFSEQTFERLLGVDGTTECPMYVVGVGVKPDGPTRNPGFIPE